MMWKIQPQAKQLRSRIHSKNSSRFHLGNPAEVSVHPPRIKDRIRETAEIEPREPLTQTLLGRRHAFLPPYEPLSVGG